MNQFIQFVISHWMLWVALAIVLFLLIQLEGGAQRGIAMMLPQQVVNLMNQENARVLDIRSEEAFAGGHITGSENIKADTTDLGDNKQQPLVIVCKMGRSCINTAVALKKAGYEKVYALKGGTTQWAESGLPLVANNGKS